MKRVSFTPDSIYVDREVEGHARTAYILDRLPGIPVRVVDDLHALKRITNLGRAKKEMILTRHRGTAFKACQGMPNSLSSRAERSAAEGSLAVTHQKARDSSTPSLCSVGRNDNVEHICCRYHVVDLVSGCPMDCSYCILQHYLENNPRTTVYVNADEILAEMGRFLQDNRDRSFRIGTGELGDSLALDHVTGHAPELIGFFAQHDNALLELKTKTDFVDHLLELPHNGRTVISWSVNAELVIEGEERCTASLAKRLAAAARCAAAGYRVGFHFDPIIISDGSAAEMKGYVDVADRIFEAVDAANIAWISLGLLRLPFAMKALVQRRFPHTRIFSGELVPAGGKMRYARFLRENYYRPLWDTLTKKLPPEKVYLCMETPAVWQRLDCAIACHEDLERRLTSLRDMRQGCP